MADVVRCAPADAANLVLSRFVPARQTSEKLMGQTVTPPTTIAATFVTNAILVERTFNIPGVLRLTTAATGSIEGKGVVDYPVLQGIVITGALFVVLASLAADFALAWLDPRIRS